MLVCQYLPPTFVWSKSVVETKVHQQKEGSVPHLQYAVLYTNTLHQQLSILL